MSDPRKGFVAAVMPTVAFEQEDHPNLVHNLERQLQAARAAEVDGFTSARDWPDFQKRRGVVQGLDLAISICQQQQKLLSGQ